MLGYAEGGGRMASRGVALFGLDLLFNEGRDLMQYLVV